MPVKHRSRLPVSGSAVVDQCESRSHCFSNYIFFNIFKKQTVGLFHIVLGTIDNSIHRGKIGIQLLLIIFQNIIAVKGGNIGCNCGCMPGNSGFSQ